MSLSPHVEEPKSEVKKLINVRTWTTVSSPVSVLCISLYLNLYMCRWIEISLWLWYDYDVAIQNWLHLYRGVRLLQLLCFDLRPGPPKNAIPRWCTGRKWHFPMAVRRGNRVGGNWLMKWDKVILMVHYRVMHRKRVTSELHDSYFRLMTIKHSISKIEWASNDYIIELSSTNQLNWVLGPVEFDAQGGSWVEDRTEL